MTRSAGFMTENVAFKHQESECSSSFLIAVPRFSTYPVAFRNSVQVVRRPDDPSKVSRWRVFDLKLARSADDATDARQASSAPQVPPQTRVWLPDRLEIIA
ncbi:hypothetical protein SVAN01_05539 [Stagonosporopsis vannaccii]|nr:hypothetical protein SVAN01_05539 [Stagonosporopsis vannaccii]